MLRQLPTVRAMGKPNRTEGVATRTSQQAASSAPSPTQAPARAATVGTRTASSAMAAASARSSRMV